MTPRRRGASHKLQRWLPRLEEISALEEAARLEEVWHFHRRHRQHEIRVRFILRCLLFLHRPTMATFSSTRTRAMRAYQYPA